VRKGIRRFAGTSDVKVAILAGGLGSRMGGETELRPKPMVEIGGRPILWHIMRYYACYGHRDFVVALGYRGDVIRRYATDFATLQAAHLRIDYDRHAVELAPANNDTWPMEGWTLELRETGADTNTGGRIRRLREAIGNERFLLTWGDGVADVDLRALLDFHRSHGRWVTMTAVRPPPRFGHLDLEGDRIIGFQEKPARAEGWINGAFFVCEPQVFDLIDGDDTQFEREPLQRLAAAGQLMAYRHDGFWQCMDTPRDKATLEQLWASGRAPWKIWN
jgi:glucose-1-phosphate cytidylyltransferase